MVSAPSGDEAQFPVFAVTVDITLFVVVGGELHVLLIQRGIEPFAGLWALPGGFKTPSESLLEAARRELAEETGVASADLRQFGAFGDPNRDPRGNVVTVGFYSVACEQPDIDASTDAANAAFWPVQDVLSRKDFLAFDHHLILDGALQHLRREIEVSDLIQFFVPDTFSIRALQRVCESVWDCHLDPSNLRRALNYKESEWIRRVGQRGLTTSQGGRPAELFEFTGDWSRGGPMRSIAKVAQRNT